MLHVSDGAAIIAAMTNYTTEDFDKRRCMQRLISPTGETVLCKLPTQYGYTVHGADTDHSYAVGTCPMGHVSEFGYSEVD